MAFAELQLYTFVNRTNIDQICIYAKSMYVFHLVVTVSDVELCHKSAAMFQGYFSLCGLLNFDSMTCNT